MLFIDYREIDQPKRLDQHSPSLQNLIFTSPSMRLINPIYFYCKSVPNLISICIPVPAFSFAMVEILKRRNYWILIDFNECLLMSLLWLFGIFFCIIFCFKILGTISLIYKCNYSTVQIGWVFLQTAFICICKIHFLECTTLCVCIRKKSKVLKWVFKVFKFNNANKNYRNYLRQKVTDVIIAKQHTSLFFFNFIESGIKSLKIKNQTFLNEHCLQIVKRMVVLKFIFRFYFTNMKFFFSSGKNIHGRIFQNL